MQIKEIGMKMSGEIFEILKIGYLYAEIGMTYNQIASYLDLSLATVARRITAAREEGWLVEKICFIIPEEFQSIRSFIVSEPVLEEKILKRFDGKIESVTIVPSDNDLRICRKFVAMSAARLLEQKLVENGFFGVNWGRTVLEVANTIRPTTAKPSLTCVPIFGEVLPPDNEKYSSLKAYSSSYLAELFSQMFNAQCPIHLTFQAFIQAEFAHNPKELEIIKRYLQSNESYQKIFGENGLITKIDSLLSGIGALSHDSAWFSYTSRLNKRDPETEFLELQKKGVVGDIGQHFVTKEGFEVQDGDPVISEINNRVIGLHPLKHFLPLAQKYRATALPRKGTGVLIVAAGVHKVPIIYVALKSGMINHLIIPKDVGEMLLSM